METMEVERLDEINPRCTQSISSTCLACSRFHTRKEGGKHGHHTGRTYAECTENFWESKHMYNWTSEDVCYGER